MTKHIDRQRTELLKRRDAILDSPTYSEADEPQLGRDVDTGEIVALHMLPWPHVQRADGRCRCGATSEVHRSSVNHPERDQ